MSISMQIYSWWSLAIYIYIYNNSLKATYKYETTMTASVLTQDPNTYKCQRIYYDKFISVPCRNKPFFLTLHVFGSCSHRLPLSSQILGSQSTPVVLRGNVLSLKCSEGTNKRVLGKARSEKWSEKWCGHNSVMDTAS